MYRLFLTVLCALSLGSLNAQEDSVKDYTDGVFVVNEDWYGHNNGTINFLTDDGEWYYRVFQEENPGHELGSTTQFGTIYGNRIYIVSKQDKDPGDNKMGSRLAVCDASTMKVLAEFPLIATDDKGRSVADGRSFLPVDEHKGYIGTNNGIWLFDTDNLSIGRQIEGTANLNTDGYGSLYLGQVGSMVRANDMVFAVHQQHGIMVIDAVSDTICRVIEAPTDEENGKEVKRGFGSIVMSKDGTLWASIAKDTSGNGSSVPYIYHIDPYTFDVERIEIPAGTGMIPNSWYAWTADGFCASAQENKIYWKDLPEGGSWFSSTKIYGYDIDGREFFEVTDLADGEGNWNFYGSAFRIHPVTDEIYAFLYHDFQDPTHMLVRMNTRGEVLNEYPMIENYWFPALPVFPDNADPVVSDLFPTKISLDNDNPVYALHLAHMATDADNMDAAIVKSVSVLTADSPIKAGVRNDSLIVSSCADAAESHKAEIEVRFNSNGKVVRRSITVSSGGDTGIGEVSTGRLTVYPNTAVSEVRVNTNAEAHVKFFTMDGSCIKHVTVKGGEAISIGSLAKGMYIVRIETAGRNEIIKLMKL